MSARGARVVASALALSACAQGPDPSTLVAAPPAAPPGIPKGAPGALGWAVDLPAATTIAPRKKLPMPVIPPSPMAPPLGPKGHGSGAAGGTAL